MLSSLLSRKNKVACTHPTTLLLSVHKGASSFLSNDLGPAIARAFSGMRHIEMGQEIVNGKKLIMLRRDPRDVAVSLYYSIRFSHTSKTRDPEAFLDKKAALENLDVVEGILQHTSKTAINQFLATFRFIEKYPHTCLTTYEALTMDFPAWRAAIEKHMRWSAEDAAKVFAGLDKSIEPPSKVDPHKHKRRVTPGNWREVFDDRVREVFERRIGRELKQAGYAW
jgi:hypothetical protein